MFKTITCQIFLLMLTGCGLLTYQPEPDFQLYIDNLQFTDQPTEFIHSELGIKRLREEPLRSEFIDCINQAYAGVSVELDGIEVNDPLLLDAMLIDFTAHAIANSMKVKFREYNDDVKVARFMVMESEEFAEIRPVLKKHDRKVIPCLESRGWKVNLFAVP